MVARPAHLRGAVALAALTLLPACLASTVVQHDARSVVQAEPTLDWRAAEAADLDGLYESVRLEGDAAAALWKLYYHFARDGSYTGAALVFDGECARFQTLSGTWSLVGGRLDLDGSSGASAAVAGDHLRISSEAGTALFIQAAGH
jgi:hypothetical protein